MAVINTNVAAQISANALAKNDRAMTQSMQRLATGTRINSASDDAAGLAVASKLTSQVRGLSQAVRNGNDAIAVLQTIDGAATEVSNMLQRMRELTVQGGTGTLSSTDLTALNTEFVALRGEVDRIANNTQWNGDKLMDGTAGNSNGTMVFQVGYEALQTVSVELGDWNLNSTAVTGVAAVYTAAGITDSDVTAMNGSFVISDGENTLTITMDSTDATETVAHLAALIEADGSLTRLTAADNGTAGGVLALTYDNAALVSVAPTITLAGANQALTETTAGVSAMTSVLGADLSALTITTAALSNTSLQSLDVAIAGVDKQRSTVGSAINTLEFAVDNLSNAKQNAQAARSRIADTDYATETTELARTQIIAQAATAMLSQANQQAMSVMALLK
jgi:flagellin